MIHDFVKSSLLFAFFAYKFALNFLFYTFVFSSFILQVVQINIQTLVLVSLYSQYLENYLWPNFISSQVRKFLGGM